MEVPKPTAQERHAAHEALPVPAAKCPGAHEAHVALDRALNRPAAHTVHDALPAAAARPASQGEQAPAPAVAALPAAHRVLRALPSHAKPAGHAPHALSEDCVGAKTSCCVSESHSRSS